MGNGLSKEPCAMFALHAVDCEFVGDFVWGTIPAQGLSSLFGGLLEDLGVFVSGERVAAIFAIGVLLGQ